MKFTCSLDDDNGLMVSLGVSISEAYPGPLSEDSRQRFSGEDLVASAFVRVIPQLSALLEQVHLSAGTTILSSYSEALKDKGDDVGKEAA